MITVSWEEFEVGKTEEAHFVKEMDIIGCLIGMLGDEQLADRVQESEPKIRSQTGKSYLELLRQKDDLSAPPLPFLRQVSELMYLKREGWRRFMGDLVVESVADHSWRVALMALVLAPVRPRLYRPESH